MKFLFSLLFHNIKIKILSITMAFAVFTYISLSNISDKSVMVSTSVISPVPPLIVAEAIPEEVEVFLTGPRSELRDIDISRFEVPVDLSHAASGSNVKKLELQGQLPKNVECTRIEPDQLTVRVEKVHQQKIKVKPEFINRPHEDYMLNNYIIEPGYIWARGPDSLIDNLVSLRTEPISLENIAQDTVYHVKINRNLNPALAVDKNKIFKVLVTLKPRELSKKITNLPIYITNLNHKFKTTSSNALYVSNITFNINKSELKQLNITNDFIFFINALEINSPGRYRLPVYEQKPDYIKSISWEPKVISIEIKPKKTGLFNLFN